ncbi:MAG TPA: DUF4864 domain-containing protein [Gammaproteobacteria bacterium]|jgi:hypothetical protein|nr:DUF4864 domain-containing protein [Gammaproteobacteria bacterium]
MSAQSGSSVSPKSGVTTLLLCLFLGSFGAHRFYVGKVKTGLLMLVTAGGLGIWTLVDLVMIACCEFTDSEGRIVMFSRTGDSPWKLIFAIIALCFSVLVIYVVIIGGSVYYLTSGVADTIQYQLAAIREGDLEKAYSYTSADFRRATSFDAFKEFVEQVPALSDNESASFPSRSINNNEGVVSGTIKAHDGSVTSIEYLLIHEDKKWKIEGIRINPADSGELENDQSGSSSENAAKKVENLTYTDPNGEYTIRYPDNWYFDQTDKSSVMFSGKKGSQSYYATVTIQTLPMKKKGGIYGSVKDIVDDLKGQINERTTNVKFVNEGDAELPANTKDFKGQYFVVTYTYKGEDMKKMQFIIIRPDGNEAYSWGYTTPADLYDGDLPVAKSMYESWVIK